MLVEFNEVMACQVRQFTNNVSANQGKYLDLKRDPDRAAELPEAKEWPAFGNFIAAINTCEGFRTSGCMVNGLTPGGHPAPYVDVFFDNAKVRASQSPLRRLAAELLELNDATSLPKFKLELCNSEARLPDGERVLSLRLWLIGSRSDAEAAFPEIIARLSDQVLGDFITLAESDRQEARKTNRRFIAFASGWILFVSTCTWLGSQAGWLAAMLIALGSIVFYPIALFAIFVVATKTQPANADPNLTRS
jgi:hypothetical protein